MDSEKNSADRGIIAPVWISEDTEVQFLHAGAHSDSVRLKTPEAISVIDRFLASEVRLGNTVVTRVVIYTEDRE